MNSSFCPSILYSWHIVPNKSFWTRSDSKGKFWKVNLLTVAYESFKFFKSFFFFPSKRVQCCNLLSYQWKACPRITQNCAKQMHSIKLFELRIHLLYTLRREATPLLPKKESPGMILNWIWWWCSSSGDLGSVEYSFITMTSRSTLTQISSRVTFIYKIAYIRQDYLIPNK